MKERPILFSAEMTRAILDSRKTQTRRVVKAPSYASHVSLCEDEMDDGRKGLRWWAYSGDDEDGYDLHWISPQPPRVGDVLWVREAWAYYPALVGGEVYADHNDERVAVRYRATWTKRHSGPWRPSIHMPRWAARVTLTVTADARAERVQSITEADAIAEGFVSVAAFRDAWIAMYGQASWDRNDWVWVTSFAAKEIKR